MTIPPYPDGRPAAVHRLEAQGHGVVLRSGDGPGRCDSLGARDVWVFQDGGRYCMFYDGAGPEGWRCCLAVSHDLVNWEKKGPILELGKAGAPDQGYAGYGPTFYERGLWHLLYVGCRETTPPPARVPAMPYLTLKAEAERPEGPWRKRYDITPYGPAPGTYYADTANPGHILKRDGEYLSFFSAAIHGAGGVERTIGIARTRDLNGAWTPDPEPILPLGEQIENASVYYEPANGTWFLFTNHVALDEQGYEWTDAAWVYWTQDLDRWDPANKAVVVDGKTSTWAHACIGMPAAIPYGDRLAVLYDGAPGESRDHMGRRVGLAWLDLPLEPPG